MSAADRPVRPRTKMLSWRPLRQNTLRGFASIQFASGMQMSDIGVHQSGSRLWASPPSRPWVERGALVTDPAGKVRYQQIVHFSTHGVARRWSGEVLQALSEAGIDLESESTE